MIFPFGRKIRFFLLVFLTLTGVTVIALGLPAWAGITVLVALAILGLGQDKITGEIQPTQPQLPTPPEPSVENLEAEGTIESSDSLDAYEEAQLVQKLEVLRKSLLDLAETAGTQPPVPEPQDQERLMDLLTLKASSDFISMNVYQAFEISDNLANTAKTAFELSGNVQAGVKTVTESLSDSLRNTAQLFEQSKQISKILEIMSEVSEKIHILSINASIVSARAGTAGKGFEVVAKEIRSLAKETERSLGDIEKVIEDVQFTISEVVQKVDTASRQTNKEQDSLMQVAGALQGVILAVEIIRAVTSVAKEKAEEQKTTMEGWINPEDSLGSEESLEELEEIGDGLPEKLTALADDTGEITDLIARLGHKETT